MFSFFAYMSLFIHNVVSDLARMQTLALQSYRKGQVPEWGPNGLNTPILKTTIGAIFVLNMVSFTLTSRGRMFLVQLLEHAFTIMLVSIVLGIVLGLPALTIYIVFFAARLALVKFGPPVYAAIMSTISK